MPLALFQKESDKKRMEKMEVRRISAFNKELTYEEYVKIHIIKHNDSRYCKQDLIELCKKRNLVVTGRESKEKLYDMLRQSGMELTEFGDEIFLNLGVSSQMYQKAFGISHADVKRLERCGKLIIVGEYKTRAYGKYIYPPLYSAWQFVTLTEEEMKQWIDKYTKSTGMKK